MAVNTRCERCGAIVGSGILAGLCPNCMLRTALDGCADTLPPADAAAPLLRQFGSYQLLEEVARGGMGVVYRAHQVNLDRIVALKMMRPGLLATADEVRRFRAEARVAAALHHPNIVAVHEAGEHDGLHYFSMDFVEGLSLADMLREQPLAPREAAHYVRLIAEAIDYAHGQGILHRDLKPSNVIVNLDGQPRITDFGLARPIEMDSAMTLSGAAAGTPAYMAPEQAAGQTAKIGPPSDVYALGAILFEALTGHPPFEGATAHATVQMVLESEAPSPRDRNPQTPRELATICLKCLEKDPQRRYATAGQLALDLGRFLQGETIAAKPVGGLTRTCRWCRRNPWRVATSVAVLLAVLLAGQWWMSGRGGKAQQAPQASAAPPPLAAQGPDPSGPPPPPSSPPRSPAAHDGPHRFRVAIFAGPGDSGDGGPATEAWLPRVNSLAADTFGNLYISDSSCHCIRKVGPDGNISRVAGVGVPGFSPDGTPARGAHLELKLGQGLAVDAAGSLYFVESAGCRVRKIDSQGRLATVAGGRCGFGGDGGLALNALLDEPRGIAVGPDGTVFIRDDNNHRIRAVTRDGIIHTVAGTGVPGNSGNGGPALVATLDPEFQIAADGKGSLYLPGSCHLRSISPDGAIQVIAGLSSCGFSGDGGRAAQAQVGLVHTLAADLDGNVYFADGPRIRKIATDGSIGTVADLTSHGAAQPTTVGLPFLLIRSLAADPSNQLYATVLPGNTVLRIDGGGPIHVVAGSLEIHDGVPATASQLNQPTAVAAAPDGSIYISDFYNRRIWRVARDGIIRTAAAPLDAADTFSPRGLAVDRAGNLFAGDGRCFCVWRFSADGTRTKIAGSGVSGYSGDGGPASEAVLGLPMAVAADRNGGVFIADTRNNAIRAWMPDGIIRTVAGRMAGFAGDGGPAAAALLRGPSALAFDGRGNLWIADAGNFRVRRVSPDGSIDTVAGNGLRGHAGEGGPATLASIGPPTGIATDSAGSVYFTDPDFRCVWMVAADGVLRKAADIPHPFSIAAAPEGRLFVVDDLGNRVYQLTPER
jgi:sugar lactone lactonase YvrE